MGFAAYPLASAPFSGLALGANIDVAVTGVQVTASISPNFLTTLMGIEATGHAGQVSGTGFANVEAPSLLMTASLGNTFETLNNTSATTSIGTITVVIDETVNATGIEATTHAGTVAVSGDANVTLSAMAGLTSTIGNVFETLMGVQGTTTVGNGTTVSGDANLTLSAPSALTSSIGDTFQTLNAPSTMTSAIGSISVHIHMTVTLSAMAAMTGSTHALSSVTGTANVYPTGAVGTATAGSVFMWSDILPSQNPNFNAITPSQTPNWTNTLEAA